MSVVQDPSRSLSSEVLADRRPEALSRELVRLYAKFMGRGPTKARAYVYDDYALCVLRDVLTRGEHTLVEGGHTHTVLEARLYLHEALLPELTQIAATECDREVSLCIAQFEPAADLAIEFFHFEPAGSS